MHKITHPAQQPTPPTHPTTTTATSPALRKRPPASDPPPQQLTGSGDSRAAVSYPLPGGDGSTVPLAPPQQSWARGWLPRKAPLLETETAPIPRLWYGSWSHSTALPFSLSNLGVAGRAISAHCMNRECIRNRVARCLSVLRSTATKVEILFASGGGEVEQRAGREEPKLSD